MKYVSLHHHTTFSYGDGYGLPDAHFARAAELGMKALASTEHGNTSSHVQVEKASKKYGIKGVYGCEAYTAPADMRSKKNMRKWHLTILAADQPGYINLNMLVSRSWSDGFYRWPTVIGRMLKRYNEGLIVLSGCADSQLACALLGGKGVDFHNPDIPAALKVIGGFKDLFGDRYYLECQQFPELERSRTLNAIYAELSKKTGVPLVASSDCHYPMPNDNEMQKILHAASRNTGTVAAAEADWEYSVLLTFPTSDKFIEDKLIRTGLSRIEAQGAIDNTAIIADRCNVVLPKSEQIRFPLPAGVRDAKELIWQWLRDGWSYRWERNALMRARKSEYQARIKYEMSVIEPRDFCDYFSMLSESVRWAKDNGIPVGPARGSAAASLVCYMLRITEVDPMQFPNMMFERFIDAERADLPDVDLDFADDRRDEVRQHLVELYGKDHVGNIGNFTRYRGKNAINDVARVHQVPKWEASIINDLVIERSGGDSRFDASLEDTKEMFPAAKAIFDKYPVLDFAIRLEGNYKSMGVHAAGIVVSNAPITDTCAVYERPNVGQANRTLQVIAYDKKDAEYLGMLKADFLGLTTMGMISRCLALIGMSLDELYQIPLDDTETIAAFHRGDVIGIFQYEGRATRLMTMDVQPSNFQEIVDINALSRPGPLFSGAAAAYVEVKNGRKKPDHLHSIVDKYAAQSQYQIIYQEQVLAIIREMGGFPVQKIADIRKIISQKMGEASFNAMREEFIAGADRIHGIGERLADTIWKLMVTSATYSLCLTGDTVVETGGGQEYSLESLWDAYNSKSPLGDKLRYGHYGKRINLRQLDDDGLIRPDQFLSIKRSPVKMPVYKVTLENGRHFTGTIMHRVMTVDGYREVGDLSIGDELVCQGGKIIPPKSASKQVWHEWDGMVGPGNPAWIDGRTWFLEEAKNAVLDRSGDKCEWCHKSNDQGAHTLEFAHILGLSDLLGDYGKYHNANNLLRLCNSCHKKFDYSKGERRGGYKKGLTTEASAIVAIKPLKHKQWVYMLEMNNPNHNYVGNGVVHHNNVSHAVSYAMIGYWSCYLKVHYPTEFYAAALSKIGGTHDNQPKIAALIKDAEKHGITVVPPDIRISGPTWMPNPEGGVIAGFMQVPGIAEKSAANIMEWLDMIPNRDDLLWRDMIAVKGIGNKTVEKIEKWVTSDDPFALWYAQRVLGDIRKMMYKEWRRWNSVKPNYTSDEIPREADNLHVRWMGIPKFREYKDYVEDSRARSGQTVEEIVATMDRPDLIKGCVVKCYDDGEEEVYLRFNRFRFPNFKEMLEGLKLDGSQVVIAEGNKHSGFGINVQVQKLWIINVEEEDEEE